LPDLEEFKVSMADQEIMEQGNIVESYAKQLNVFTGYLETKSQDFNGSLDEVSQLVAKKVPAIYQPTFVADGFIVRCDFIVWDVRGESWDLFEIKGTSSKKDTDSPRDHISDIACQTIVLERAGIKVGKKFLVYLNKDYIRGAEIDVEQLFIVDDCSEQIEEKKQLTAQQMADAKAFLNQEQEPIDGCSCHLKGRGAHCETFKRSHPDVPDYSIHDLSRITPKKLAKLLVGGIMHIHEIEDVSDFTKTQQNQIHTHKTGEEIIDLAEIANILDVYSYPLYFFDYETYSTAVPIFPGYKPWQRIPIQFSLHYFESEGDPLRHIEYVHEEKSDPTDAIAKKLEQYIDPKGTVLAWNVGFERGVTEEIAERMPRYEMAVGRVCSQMKDLMDIFSKQHFVHKDFHGSASIEAIMQVLLPEMTYDHLPYTGSDVGIVWWKTIVNREANPKDRVKKLHLILEYCKQDTMVMVEIYKILQNMIHKAKV
jgi:hypothetical protein